MPIALLKQLLERKLQQRQGSHLSLYLEQQVPDQVALEAQLHIRQCSRSLDDGPQVLHLHWPDQHLALHDESPQRRVGYGPVIQIGTQCQDDDGCPLRLGHGSDQQVDQVLPLLFSGRLLEEFLELVNEQYDFLPWRLHQLGSQQVQAACRLVLQVLTHRFQTPVREEFCEREHQCLQRVSAWHHWLQVDPVFASWKCALLQAW